jgi:hypothetical protein
MYCAKVIYNNCDKGFSTDYPDKSLFVPANSAYFFRLWLLLPPPPGLYCP